MKMLQKTLLLITAPLFLNASGLAVYAPYGLGDSHAVTRSPTNGIETEYDIDYKSNLGLGLAYDGNLGEDTLSNTRFSLEYTKREVDTFANIGCTGNCEAGERINMVTTFGFGIVRTKVVRLWLGPRFNLAYNWHSRNTYSTGGLEVGIAPALGINVNIGSHLSLAADVDYRWAGEFGAWTDDLGGSGSYTSSIQGATARFYVFFRFGEVYDDGEIASTPPASQVDSEL